MGILSNLEPKNVFFYFEKICSIPHGSGNEKALSDYIVGFAKENNLYYKKDKSNNVLIKKDATKSYENAKTVILQGHIDMVCEKNSSTQFDFVKDSIVPYVEDDFIKATGTTLGADNGIAVAYCLAILSSDNLKHPALEVVFTTNEETGLNGAIAFDKSLLKGKYFINLDSEEEGYAVVSCCGGVRSDLVIPIKTRKLNESSFVFKVTIKGLLGGHSGVEINLQRANANKLMGKLLKYLEDVDFEIISINGGLMDNAIPRECEALLCFDSSENMNTLQKYINKWLVVVQDEFKGIEENINISFEKMDVSNKDISSKEVFDFDTKSKVISALLLIPNGVYYYNAFMKDLVETSTNVGVIVTNFDKNTITFSSAVRSNVSSRKDELKSQINELAFILGGETFWRGDYPGWEYKPNSKLVEIYSKTFENMFNYEPKIISIHAGLECGVFDEKIEGLELISIGPDMFNVHTPDEKLSISSTERTWKFLVKYLEELNEVTVG